MRAALGVAALVAVTACAADDPPASVDGPADDGGSAVIVTTTSVATTDPSTDADPPTTTSDATTEATSDSTPDTADTSGSSVPASEPPASVVATTAPATVPAPTVGEPTVSFELVVSGLDRPVDLVVRPGDDALYIVEQVGRVIRVDGDDRTTVADLSDRTDAAGERGLLGWEFAPDGALAYANYTNRDRDTVIAEFPVDEAGRIDTARERLVMLVDQPYNNHNGGDLEFGPDGMLYIPLGDGGNRDDPDRRAHDPSSWLGSLLRIDPSPSDGRPYTVPSDNPFADGGEGAPEVWAWGLRNPWKIAFDPVTDALWIADVGQNQFEEVNVAYPIGGTTAARGADFGWSAFEAFERFNDDVPDTGSTIDPVLAYRHRDGGCSVSGGAPYRGTAVPGLEPAYVYGDYCTGRVWALDLDTSRNLELTNGLGSITAVRAGPDGELYVLLHEGEIRRIVAA